tara:strand:+ start:657 stop:1328 length:672 start_codon:yes stop_codon:yes gene_type:complete
MTFNPIVLIMQPREIEESINSLKENVDIPKVWFRAFTEEQVMHEMNCFIENTNYSHYIINGDDVIVYKDSMDVILKYAQRDEYEVFTGWMNMYLEDDGNLSKSSTVQFGEFPALKKAKGPQRDEYPPKMLVDEVLNLPKEVIQTSMASFAMSCASRELFLRFPLKTHLNGFSSDHHFSYRLQEAGVKVWTHPDAFIKHLRRGWSPLKVNWLVDKIEPEIVKEL